MWNLLKVGLGKDGQFNITVIYNARTISLSNLSITKLQEIRAYCFIQFSARAKNDLHEENLAYCSGWLRGCCRAIPNAIYFMVNNRKDPAGGSECPAACALM
jgi:hypothetical protein